MVRPRHSLTGKTRRTQTLSGWFTFPWAHAITWGHSDFQITHLEDTHDYEVKCRFCKDSVVMREWDLQTSPEVETCGLPGMRALLSGLGDEQGRNEVLEVMHGSVRIRLEALYTSEDPFHYWVAAMNPERDLPVESPCPPSPWALLLEDDLDGG